MTHPVEAVAAPVVAVADQMALRRAAVLGLLSDWAAPQGATLQALSPEKAAADMPEPRLVILGLGALSVMDMAAAAWVTHIRSTWPRATLAVVSDLEETEEVVAALRAGARGFIPTSTEPDVALPAFAFLLRGGSYFPPGAVLGRARGNSGRGGNGGGPTGREGTTHRQAGLGGRQQSILALLQDGCSNKEIGRMLGLPESMVKVHVRRILRRLGVANRTEAALAAQRQAAGVSVLTLPRRSLKGAA